MYAPCLLLVALILSAFPPAAQQQRRVAPMGGITIVERLRSEILVEKLDARLGPQPTLHQRSCWWLWLLSGIDVCRESGA